MVTLLSGCIRVSFCRSSSVVALFLLILICFFAQSSGLREFRLWSTRHLCEKSRFVNYPFVYSKYDGQLSENKGRVNTNEQDFRHTCEARGGYSKCHICEDIICGSDTSKCHLQLQGVDSNAMSTNIPQLSDHAWAVKGLHRHDYGGSTTTHFCVMLSGGGCIQSTPTSAFFHSCVTRCFGYGFTKPAVSRGVNPRSVVDVYPGMHKWVDDGEVDLWTYPRNCSELRKMQNRNCTYTTANSAMVVPNFNPQGFSFTAAGNGSIGMKDGPVAASMFYAPEDITVDKDGVIYVADTGNNAIRMIKGGKVTLLAGGGPSAIGFKDGPCAQATFSAPKGIDVRLDTLNGVKTAILAIADTGNHRIRRLEYVPSTGSCWVKCLTGLCGNNSLSAADYKFQAYPLTGYADGHGFEARFSSPESVAFMDNNFIVVADTGNFLLRWVADNGTTTTLAGSVRSGLRDPEGNPMAGCTPPCLVGQKGYRDGNLTYVQFMNPLDVTRGPNNTVWIADEHRIRVLELPGVTTELYSIRSMGRVSTIAGSTLDEYTNAATLQGHDDGVGERSTFFDPSGLFVTSDNIVHVVDSASCRVRRITPMPIAAQKIKCDTRAVELIRPSGCTSFDQVIDKIGMKVSRVEANIQYNYGDPYVQDRDRGKYIKNCVGSPPSDKLDKRFVNITDGGDNLVIDDYRTRINEDSEQGTAIIVFCPSGCLTANRDIFGDIWYSEESSVCTAAIHAGILTNAGGYLQFTLERFDYLRNPTDPTLFTANIAGGVKNGILSQGISESVPRVFKMELFYIYQNLVHTIGGAPMAPLESGCGFYDAQPPLQAYFNRPTGTAAIPGTALSNTNFLYIADAGNNRIRAISAVCTQICENGAVCVAHDTCQCLPGWKGLDCATPICNSLCSRDKVCVAPNTCDCKPGYGGANCQTPLCIQSCRNGGTCAAPDTCSCPTGWFDSNCTTPVCPRTCANGGNCTAPNQCACPDEWTGLDCRVPVCRQTCLNGGLCVGPDTCICSPQWIGFDCSIPVCQQGYFKPNSQRFDELGAKPSLYSSSLETWPTYKYCNLKQWCNYTNEFECDQYDIQQAYLYNLLEVPSGPKHRHKTGRKVPPTQCMIIELPLTYKIPFELLRADGSTTGHMRYSPNTPYLNDIRNSWRGYETPTLDHTGPWTYQPDRQLAYVNWINMTQGVYVCANNGNCTAPDICECAPGWSGFDCRTPICEQGYWHPTQTTYVSGENVPQELSRFLPFMGYNSYRLNNTITGEDPTLSNPSLKRNIHHMYSNPNYTINWEFYDGVGRVIQQDRVSKGKRYLGLSDWSSGYRKEQFQGGYRCSVRAVTKWENLTEVFVHPNYYSQYMDTKVELDFKVYSDWVGMRWPPTHYKSKVLDQLYFNITFTYTNEGYRRWGVWNKTGKPWVYGICLMEFDRNCTDSKADFDIESGLFDAFVQDTDLAFRPRMYYDDRRVFGPGRWHVKYGQCVDQVVRGCYNNGTCVAPNTCSCAEGWTGYNCNIPICKQICNHNGNCTNPDVCTCAQGWSGYDCSIPLCAQECQNGGVCVAPDVCKCKQWENRFRDGRLAGGRPLYQDDKGNPLPTGWTGYDCSVPICVQAEFFYVNTYVSDRAYTIQNPTLADPQGLYHYMGGHGADALMNCTDKTTGNNMPRCPQFDAYVTGNDGTSFQSGCGFDPLDTGCCVPRYSNIQTNDIVCYFCPENLKLISENTFECTQYFTVPVKNPDLPFTPEYFKSGKSVETEKFKRFADSNGNLKMCGRYHSPRSHNLALDREDYGTAKYYRDRDVRYSSYNYLSNLTSNRFLCLIKYWYQGDYKDDAGLSTTTAVGSIFGLSSGRHIRTNFPNIIRDIGSNTYKLGPRIVGEGLYACGNKGSCMAPDVCSCTDGYEGYDCFTPLCRHLQPKTWYNPDGAVTGCLNGGICSRRDFCNCIQTESVSWQVHTGSARGLTGWTGSDCSIPMCTQGYFDPYCTDLKQAPAGEGCFRCSNGGNCTAPDICTCAKGWSGFDCRTPVCETVADPLTRTQLGTIFEDKVISFEEDPCQMITIHGWHGWHGRKYTRGNCSLPNQCTCLCKLPFSVKACKKLGLFCDGPWQDPMASLRNLLVARGVEYGFGSVDCAYGYEGNVDDMDRFTTCHQTVFLPSSSQRDSVALIVVFVFFGFLGSVGYYYVSARIKKRMLLAKIERRRSKRSSEESLTKADVGAFQSK